MDVEDRSGKADLLGDIQDMPQVESACFETVLCTQVLEHVPRPREAVAELARVLVPGGMLILTAPHLSIVHEVPHDYYRYTRYGLATLCGGAGMVVEEVSPTAGLLAFLGHGVSGLLMSTVGSLPFLRWPVWGVNYVLFVLLLAPLDFVLGLSRLYPCDHLLVARKAEGGSTEGPT